MVLQARKRTRCFQNLRVTFSYLRVTYFFNMSLYCFLPPSSVPGFVVRTFRNPLFDAHNSGARAVTHPPLRTRHRRRSDGLARARGELQEAGRGREPRQALSHHAPDTGMPTAPGGARRVPLVHVLEARLPLGHRLRSWGRAGSG